MTPSSARFPVLAAVLAAACTTATPLPRVWLHAGAHGFHAEVAATPAARAKGLMGRKTLAADAAMLFVFDEADRHCFWMQDTPIPLSIAFLADDGTIVGVADMQPNTSTLHCAPETVRFALEAARGAFASKGMHVGTRLAGSPLEAP